MEEQQELLSLPLIKEYLYIRDKQAAGWTPEEKARSEHFSTLPEPFQLVHNTHNRILALQESAAALRDLEEYMRSNNIAQDSMQNGDKSPPDDASDGES